MNFRVREPYPARIFKDCGNAFLMGTMGGFVWHYVKGLRNSPKLPDDPFSRIKAGLRNGRARCLRVGGSFGAWGAMFASTEFLVMVVRYDHQRQLIEVPTFQMYSRKEDGWNIVASGFVVAAALQWRNGFRRSMMAGVFGAIFMSMFEGVGMLIQRSSEAVGPGEILGVSVHKTGGNRAAQLQQQQLQQQQQQQQH